MERAILAAKCFNTNLVISKLLPTYHVIISNVHVYSLHA